MEFGNGINEVRRVTLFGIVLGLIIGIVAFLFIGEIPSGREKWLVVVVFMPGVILTCVVGLTTLFRVKISQQYVEHVFIGRWTLSRFPLAGFQSVNLIPPAIVFSGDKKMRLVGMNLGLLSKLERAIREEKERVENKPD